MRLSLYKISQEENNDYDTYDSAVVIAKDKMTAREMHPSGRKDYWTKVGKFPSWAKTLEGVEVEYLGVAKGGSRSGVVVASYNAG